MNDLSKSLFGSLEIAPFSRFTALLLAVLFLAGATMAPTAEAQIQTASTPSIDIPVLGSTDPSKGYKRKKATTHTKATAPARPSIFSSHSSSSSRLQNKSDFGLGWKPKPLVDTNPKPVVSTTTKTPTAPPAPKIDPAAEAFLRPMLPFISAVEENLQIRPSQQQSIQSRLNNLQTVLFGGVIYQDPSESLSKIAELYPQEAQKSRQQLLSELQKKTLSPKSVFVNSPSTQTKIAAPFPPRSDASTPAPSASRAPAPKPKTSFFKSKWDDEDPFKNDPFFNDSVSSNQQPPKQNAFKALGQGLASLAAIAAPVAGSYYLNKSLGNGNVNQQLPNYSYPYGPYNSGPYGYNQYGAPILNPAGYPLGTYYQDPYSGRLLPMNTAGAAPIIRSYPPYSYNNYPYSQQSMTTRF